MLNLTLTNHHDSTLITKYGIEQSMWWHTILISNKLTFTLKIPISALPYVRYDPGWHCFAVLGLSWAWTEVDGIHSLLCKKLSAMYVLCTFVTARVWRPPTSFGIHILNFLWLRPWLWQIISYHAVYFAFSSITRIEMHAGIGLLVLHKIRIRNFIWEYGSSSKVLEQYRRDQCGIWGWLWMAFILHFQNLGDGVLIWQ